MVSPKRIAVTVLSHTHTVPRIAQLVAQSVHSYRFIPRLISVHVFVVRAVWVVFEDAEKYESSVFSARSAYEL